MILIRKLYKKMNMKKRPIKFLLHTYKEKYFIAFFAVISFLFIADFQHVPVNLVFGRVHLYPQFIE